MCQTQRISDECERSITISIYRRGDKKKPDNYRGITLSSSIMKLFTKIKSQYVEILEEEQGYGTNSFIVDAVFV